MAKVGLKKTDTVGFMTMRQACHLLNVHPNTLRRWAADGLIKEYRIGAKGQRRFNPDDVATLLGGSFPSTTGLIIQKHLEFLEAIGLA